MIASALRQIQSLVWLPLVGKELREKANRRVFYGVRAVFTVALFSYVAYELRAVFDQSVTVFMAGGVGGQLFQTLYHCELGATILVALVTVSARIAEERERGTLDLLLTTDLQPWRIVVQKFLASLFPMTTLQMVGLPVVAVYYALGGLAVADILYGALLLAAHTIHVTALCLACSAWSRTSSAAFAAATVICGGVLAVLGWAHSLDIAFGFPIPASPDARLQQWDLVVSLALNSLIFTFCAIAGTHRRLAASSSSFRLIPAAWSLLDRLFRRLNRLIGGASIARGGDLPEDSPVAWRELHRRGLGHTSYVVRLFLMTVLITAAAFMISGWLIEDERIRSAVWKAIRISVWVPYLLVLASIGSGVIAGERMRQTLELLLTVPIDGGDLLLQKASAARRVTIIALGPVTVYSIAAIVFEPMGIPFVMATAVTFLVVPFFIFWFTVLSGIVIHRRVPAFIVSLVALFVLSSPLLLNFDFPICNPVAPIVLAEEWLSDHYSSQTLLYGFISVFSLGLLALVPWSICLLSADRMFGRGSKRTDFYLVWMGGLLNSLGVLALDSAEKEQEKDVPAATAKQDQW